jgi:alkylated DNA nucleotide flippase Atl1
VTPFVTAAAGFLAAVLWFDLMHDVQAAGSSGELPEPVLASIAGYYRRVTTDAHPMNRLVALAMVATVGTIAAQLALGDAPRWVSATCLASALAATVLAATRTVRDAVRVGQRADDSSTQSRLARSVLRDHVICLTAMTLVLVLELGFGR